MSSNPCVYTGARVYIECHDAYVPADLFEVGNVTIIAMPGPFTAVATHLVGATPERREQLMKEVVTHRLVGTGAELYGNGWVWLAESRVTPIIAVPMGDLHGPRRY